MTVTKIEAVKPTAAPKKKVAAYCRVSTDNTEQLKSLEAQKVHYENFIRSHSDWEYAGLYYDSGISGTKAECRSGLQDMLRDCEAGKISYILTKSISRFARNTVDCLEIVRHLKDKNIFIYFEKEDVDTGNMDGELLLTLLSSFAAEESVSISENEKWSIRKRFQNGTYKMPYMPYGYTKGEHGEMVIDKREAETVRWIFELAMNGHSTHSIAKLLRERDIPTKKGGKWSDSTVRDMLVNEKYMGDAMFQKTYTDSNFRRHNTQDMSKTIYIKEHHEPIVSREIFEAVGALIQQRAAEKGAVRGNGKYQIRYEFSGKIICGECGGTFKRRIHDHGSEIAWVCATHIDDIRQCSMKYIRDDALKAAITTMINKLIFGRKLILAPYLAALRKSNVNDTEIQKLKAELKKESEKSDMLRILFANKMITPAIFQQDMGVSSKQSEELRRQIELLSRSDGENSAMTTEAEKLLKFAEKSDMLTEYREELTTEFIEKIVIYDRKNIGIQLRCGLTLKEVLP